MLKRLFIGLIVSSVFFSVVIILTFSVSLEVNGQTFVCRGAWNVWRFYNRLGEVADLIYISSEDIDTGDIYERLDAMCYGSEKKYEEVMGKYISAVLKSGKAVWDQESWSNSQIVNKWLDTHGTIRLNNTPSVFLTGSGYGTLRLKEPEMELGSPLAKVKFRGTIKITNYGNKVYARIEKLEIGKPWGTGTWIFTDDNWPCWIGAAKDKGRKEYGSFQWYGTALGLFRYHTDTHHVGPPETKLVEAQYADGRGKTVMIRMQNGDSAVAKVGYHAEVVWQGSINLGVNLGWVSQRGSGVSAGISIPFVTSHRWDPYIGIRLDMDRDGAIQWQSVVESPDKNPGWCN